MIDSVTWQGVYVLCMCVRRGEGSLGEKSDFLFHTLTVSLEISPHLRTRVVKSQQITSCWAPPLKVPPLLYTAPWEPSFQHTSLQGTNGIQTTAPGFGVRPSRAYIEARNDFAEPLAMPSRTLSYTVMLSKTLK